MWSVPLWTLPGASNSMDIIGDAYEQYMNEVRPWETRTSLRPACTDRHDSSTRSTMATVRRWASSSTPDGWTRTATRCDGSSPR